MIDGVALSLPLGGNRRGFTLIELLMVMALFSILASFAVINLARPQVKTSVDSAVRELVADIKHQQLKAMTGDGGSSGTAQSHGIYLQSSAYTLFKGSTFSTSDEENFTIQQTTGITITTTLPSSQLVFSRVSGEVSGFVAGQNTILLTNDSGESKTITVNSVGSITLN